ncbi:hypothetical protein [uncultured Chryseobacterium sp.]|uniref:hypothetical protein n=1 Tax=uncultured Chryseobacterium sp. TaxID=259322 RepID=UPI00374A8A86
MNLGNFKTGLLSVLISIAVTVLGGLILYYFQNKKPKIQYSVEKILPFESQTEKLNIYHITIENNGNEVAEDVVCKIDINPASIKEYRTNSESPISIKDSILKKEIDVKTSTLNPEENYRVSILASSKSNFPNKPIVKVRAKGVIGEEIKNVSNNDSFGSLLLNNKDLILYATIASILTLLVRRKIIKDDEDNEKHLGDQNEIIAYLCGINDLNNQIERYLTLPNKTSYWSEMDRLTAIAISSNDVQLTNNTIALIENLIVYANMAKSSIGIGEFNLAKLYKKLNDEAKFNEKLNLAKEKMPKLIETRMKVDPFFTNN